MAPTTTDEPKAVETTEPAKDAPTKSRPKRVPKPAKSAKAKPKAAPKFEPNLVAAVAYARNTLHKAEPGLGDRRPSAASVGDHRAVRERVREMIGHEPTAKEIVAASGLKSLAAIERVAKWDKAEDMTPLRTLAAEFKGQPSSAWRSGHYLAGILAAWAREVSGKKA